ncbi:MAG: SDR family NAD(P)-dependent oxidoreductase, partial [Planctomycetota bacterium]
MPYRPIILKSLTSKEAVDFAASAEKEQGRPYPAPLAKGKTPPLFCQTPAGDTDPENLRKQLSDAILRYSTQYNSKPEIICVRDLAVFYVDKTHDNPDLPLENKVALVTGAGGAIGYAICRGLLENGCHLAASDFEREKLDRLVTDLRETASERTTGVLIDVTDQESVVRGFESVIEMWGGIDIVVVNAGIAIASHLKEIDLDDFRRLEKVNVEGALLTLRQAGRHFILQGIGGDIIVISTKNVPSPGAGFGAYSATKAACHQLGRIA